MKKILLIIALLIPLQLNAATYNTFKENNNKGELGLLVNSTAVFSAYDAIRFFILMKGSNEQKRLSTCIDKKISALRKKQNGEAYDKLVDYITFAYNKHIEVQRVIAKEKSIPEIIGTAGRAPLSYLLTSGMYNDKCKKVLNK